MYNIKVGRHRRGRPIYATHALSSEAIIGNSLLSSKIRGYRWGLLAVDEALGDDEYIFLSLEGLFETGDVYFLMPKSL